jgi:carbonic anhydrase/acetyltransferase-like protein (isoleucine patch superfamily)
MGGKLSIDTGSYAGNPTLFGELNDVYVGKYCSIAGGVVFDCGLNHNISNISSFPFNKIYPHKHGVLNNDNTTRGDIKIGNDVWIGRDSTIMSGVTIGDGAVIGTKSLVTKDVEPYSIVGGVPARHIRYRFDDDTRAFLTRIRWWDWSVEEIDAIVPILMSGDIVAFKKHCESKRYYKGFRFCFMSRSMNDNLYSKMKSLLSSDFNFVRNTTSHGDWGGAKYLYDLILDNRYDWVVNIDEDFFTFNENAIFELFDYMIENEYDYCGISDGGMCVHRQHSPIVMNPFFNIFNSKKIRDALDNVSYVETFRYDHSMYRHMPDNIKEGFNWTNDNYEPYYPFFYWLPERGFKPLYLESNEAEDGISTVLKNHLGVDIGIHTWYTRNYGVDQFHTDRINKAYELALRKNQK